MNLEQIDTSTTAGKAEVMQLAAEGRRVAITYKGSAGPEEIFREPKWNWAETDYSIITEKPKRPGPPEVWVVVENQAWVPLSVHRYKDLAEECSAAYAGETHSVRYIRSDLAGEGGA